MFRSFYRSNPLLVFFTICKFAFNFTTYLFFRGSQKREVNRNEGASVGPAQCHHAEAFFELHADMVEYFGRQFGVFIANPLVEGIIDNKAVCPVRGSQPAQMFINDLLREQCSEAKPVGMGTAKETVIRILGKILFEASRFLLHVHAPVAENIAEDVGEQLHKGNIFFLLAVAFIQEGADF